MMYLRNLQFEIPSVLIVLIALIDLLTKFFFSFLSLTIICFLV